MAQGLKRNWVGIDIAFKGAIDIIQKRLWDSHGLKINDDYDFYLWPSDEYSEETLKKKNPEGYAKWEEFLRKAKKPYQRKWDKRRIIMKKAGRRIVYIGDLPLR